MALVMQENLDYNKVRNKIGGMDMNIKKRLIPCVIIVVVTLTCVLLSRYTRIMFFLALAVVSAMELQDVLFKAGMTTSSMLMILYITVQAVLCGVGASLVWMVALFAAAAFAAVLWAVLKPERGGSFASANLFVLMWPFLFYAIILHAAASRSWLIVLTLSVLGTWACDSMALVGGKYLGAHKLAPVVSPNKTWEGAVVGGVSAALAGMLISLLFGWSFGMCVSTAFIASCFGQVGDLVASLFKRMAGVKDYGNVLPEHGGIMDKMDSILFSIPAAYFWLYMFWGYIF